MGVIFVPVTGLFYLSLANWCTEALLWNEWPRANALSNFLPQPID